MKLSEAQRRVLTHLANGKQPHYSCQTRSDWGGLHGTINALYKRKLIDEQEQITDAGRKALADVH